MDHDDIMDMNRREPEFSLPATDPDFFRRHCGLRFAPILDQRSRTKTARRHRTQGILFALGCGRGGRCGRYVINLVQLPERGPLLGDGGDTVAMSANESDLI